MKLKKAVYCLLGLTFLQNLSADVTKLRLNDNVISKIANRREVWVNRNDGTIYEQNENEEFVNIENQENKHLKKLVIFLSKLKMPYFF